MTFVNQIAEIAPELQQNSVLSLPLLQVHGLVCEFHGAPNKNSGALTQGSLVPNRTRVIGA